MNSRGRIAGLIAAQDPAHARLATASAITLGTLASAAFGQLVVHDLHADPALLSMSIVLSVQAGNMVKGATARARVATTALMIPATAVVIALAAALSSERWLVIAGFILTTGLAVWVRQFGPRASALGAIGFMAYFFTLFMNPTHAELPTFALVAAGAIIAQVVARAVLMLKRPTRQLEVLLNELRAGSLAAVGLTGRSRGVERERVVRAALARLDNVGRAITQWQRGFVTREHAAVSADQLADLVLDARVDTEEACLERLQGHHALELRNVDTGISAEAARAEQALYAVLDEHSSRERVRRASEYSAQLINRGDTQGARLPSYLLARSAVSHARLRAIKLIRTRDRGHQPPSPLASVPRERASAHPVASAPDASGRARLLRWRDWPAASRMAAQAMVAALIAAGVGESISATRWYWAVMTAFVIFIGVNSRGGILTRAYRRVAGTVAGIVLGGAAVVLAGSHESVTVGICVVAVFGMLYFGPLSYFYSAMFMTMMLVALYRMLGVLNTSILELRLVETLAGAIIGVLCAYLIVSSTSRPALLARVDAYFDALDSLLRFVTGDHVDDPAEPMRLLRALETAQANLDQAVTAVSTAFAVSRPHGESEAVQLMFDVSRASARLVQAVLDRPTESAQGAAPTQELSDAVGSVLEASSLARRVLHGETGTASDGSALSADIPVVDQLRTEAHLSPAARDALLALGRIHWALRQLIGRRDRAPR